MTASILQFVGPSHCGGEESVNHYQHVRAVAGHTNAHGRAIIKMLQGWAAYSDANKAKYDEGLDYVLGPYWANVGFAIKRLLDGETGGLDCGSIAHNITARIEAEGFVTDGYTLTR